MMRVLITGGYGFIGTHVSERFHKEGHDVYILDNLSTGDASYITFKHKSFQIDISDRKCEEVFRSGSFDVVVHLAGEDDAHASMEQPVVNTQTNLLGLVNILHLSAKYKVKKLIYASSAAVYGNELDGLVDEEHPSDPATIYAMNKRLGEMYCERWMSFYQLDTLSLRLTDVYGPRQHVPLDSYMNKRTTMGFIFVTDVADAIYRASNSVITGIYNLSAPAQEADAPQPTGINNAKLKRELDWFPLYPLEEGIARTNEWFAMREQAAGLAVKTRGSRSFSLPGWLKRILPFMENIVVFLLLAYLSMKYDIMHTGSFDYRLVYIMLFGILYGSKQSIFSVVYSAGLLIYLELQNGRDFISLLYDPSILFQFALYLFFGLAVGYATDRKQQIIQSRDYQIAAQKEKLDFLNEVFQDTLSVKRDLQEQIINNGDSLGKIYSIIKELESLEPEKVIQSTVTVLEKIMRSSSISIYSVKPHALSYIRLLVKSNHVELSQQKSLKLADYPELLRTIETKQLYVNRDLKPDMPMMVAPILNSGDVVALVCIHKVDFDRMTLYYENLFHICVDLISSSVSRAFQYVAATADQRYIEGSMILKPEFFREILETKQEALEKLGSEYTLLSVSIENQSLHTLSEVIVGALRDSDYVGLDRAGTELHLLLSNTSLGEARYVIDRLSQTGVHTTIVAGDVHA